jgi:hypothetical protein
MFCNWYPDFASLDVASPDHASPDDPPLLRCVPCTMCPLYDASLVRCVPCTMRPFYDASLVLCVPCTMRLLYDASLVQCVPFTKRPLYDESLVHTTHDLFFPLLFTASLIFRDISSGFSIPEKWGRFVTKQPGTQRPRDMLGTHHPRDVPSQVRNIPGTYHPGDTQSHVLRDTAVSLTQKCETKLNTWNKTQLDEIHEKKLEGISWNGTKL